MKQDQQAHLAMARYYIAESEQRIFQQLAFIAASKRNGYDTTYAEKTLQLFKESLMLMYTYLDILTHDSSDKRSDYGPS